MEENRERNPETPVIEPEVMPKETAVEKRNPGVPVTIDELAVIEDDGGVAVALARSKIIDTLRRESIRLTVPQDWLLFRTPEGAVTAYCQDSGCKRFWQIWGIEITPVLDAPGAGEDGFIKIVDEEKPEEYGYQCFADGYCQVTKQRVHNIAGVRYSTEDFCKDVAIPMIKDQRVRQASIANRDGNIIRALTGMKSIAIELIEDVWKAENKGKTTEKCSLGRGYGSRKERAGGQAKDDPTPKDIPLPVCGICKRNMKYVPGTDRYAAFYSCPEKKKGQDGKYNNHESIGESEWRKKMAEQQRPSQREPGMEG